MAAATQLTVNPIAIALQKSFHLWGQRNKIFKRIYSKMPKEYWAIPEDAIAEMNTTRVIDFDLWYMKNAYRYKQLRQESKTLVFSMTQQFFADYSRGELKLERDTPKKGTRATKPKL